MSPAASRFAATFFARSKSALALTSSTLACAKRAVCSWMIRADNALFGGHTFNPNTSKQIKTPIGKSARRSNRVSAYEYNGRLRTCLHCITGAGATELREREREREREERERERGDHVLRVTASMCLATCHAGNAIG